MPNTLCHIGIQAPANGIFLKKNELLWVIIACIIPDLPWIELKLILASHMVNPYEARLYATAQASLLFCLIFSGGLGLLTKPSFRIFLILGINCLFHLLLDALQIKWGNGVHFIAPLSWKMFNINLFWPEFAGTAVMTVFGLFCLLFYWKKIVADPIVPAETNAKRAVAVLLLLVYFTGPLYFRHQLEAADTYYIATMRNIDARPGKTIELDRARYLADTKEVKVYTGETFKLTGKRPKESGRTSIKGVFTDSHTIACSAFHRSGNYRDFASLIGLFMACALLIQSLFLKNFKSLKPQQGG